MRAHEGATGAAQRSDSADCHVAGAPRNDAELLRSRNDTERGLKSLLYEVEALDRIELLKLHPDIRKKWAIERRPVLMEDGEIIEDKLDYLEAIEERREYRTRHYAQLRTAQTVEARMIRLWMAYHDYDNREASVILGYSMTTISQFRNGTVKIPDFVIEYIRADMKAWEMGGSKSNGNL